MIDRRVLVVFVVLFAVSSMEVYGGLCTEEPCSFCENYCKDAPSGTTGFTVKEMYDNYCIARCRANKGADHYDCVPLCSGETIEIDWADYASGYTDMNECVGECVGGVMGQDFCSDICTNVAEYLYDYKYEANSCLAGCVEPPTAPTNATCADNWCTCSFEEGKASEIYTEDIMPNLFILPFDPDDPAAPIDWPSGTNEIDFNKFYGGPGIFWEIDESPSYATVAGPVQYSQTKFSVTGSASGDLLFENLDGLCYEGLEGQYYMWAQANYADASPTIDPSEGYCYLPIHYVDWDDTPEVYCRDECVGIGSNVDWKNWDSNTMQCCGDDNNASDPIKYDCAYIHDSATICVQTDDGWEWISRTQESGDIFDMTCANLSILSNGTDYLYCGQYPSQNALSPDAFNLHMIQFNPDTTLEVEIWEEGKRHGYGCFADANGFMKFAECKGLEVFSSVGSTQLISGMYVGNSENPLFCVLDTTVGYEYTRMTYDLDDSMGNDGACDAVIPGRATYVWTGTKCCQEPEPGFGGLEYYDDSGGIGGCWASQYIASGNIVGNTNNLAANSDGDFYGCLIPEDDGLLDLTDNHTGADLVANLDYNSPEYNDVCHMAGGDVSYCSFEGEWRDAQSAVFYQKNTSWDYDPDDGEIPWECCHHSECWDGESCIADQTSNYSAEPTYGDEGYRCMDGIWSIPPVKHTWNNGKTGYCPNEEDCLIDPAPAVGCLANGTYFGGEIYYCEEGAWTSRTKLIALALMEYAEQAGSANDFTLFCDNYSNILNYYDYELGKGSGKFMDRYIYTQCQDGRCVNDFCVLQYPGGVAFGTSTNVDIDNPQKSILVGLEKDFNLCSDNKDDDGMYHRCDANDNIWYNHNQGAVIYLPEDPTDEPFEVSWYEKFVSFRENFFDALVRGAIATSTVKNYTFFNRTNIFTKLYVDKVNDKMVFAFLEEGKIITDVAAESETVDYLGVEYTNLDVSPCDLVKHYEEEVKGRARACNDETTIFPEYSVEGEPTIVDAWPDLTAKLRLPR